MKAIRYGVMALALMVGTGPVFAADIPLKAPVAPYIDTSWQGVYLGGSIGWKSVDNKWNTTCVDAGGPPLGNCGSPLSLIDFPGAPDATRLHNFNNSGVRPDLHVGFMLQTGNYVWGAELEYGFYSARRTVPGILGCSTAACTGGALVPFNLNGDFTSIRDGADASFLTRLGMLVTPDVLVYATGGPSIQFVQGTLQCTGATSPACAFSHTSTVKSDGLIGYTVGGGLEWKVYQHWLLRGEYRYSAYRNWNPVFFGGSGELNVLSSVKVNSQIATFGISYLIPIAR